MNICSELLGGRKPSRKIQHERYQYLHPHGRRLISGWFGRALDLLDAGQEECFEGFIFAWIAVNAWASCVTGLDIDIAIIRTMMIDPILNNYFEQMVQREDSIFSQNVREFHSLLPIFHVQAIRRARVDLAYHLPREQRIQHYLDAGIDKYAPQCWEKHLGRKEPVPLDWPHTLATLYRVRCNLFHGEKAIDSETDIQIVNSAFKIIVYLFRDSNILGYGF